MSELMSNCCGASPLWESDLCSDCKEHADFSPYDEDEQELIDIGFDDAIQMLKYYHNQGKSIEWLLQHAKNIQNDR